jgi:sRNA-binding protein
VLADWWPLTFAVYAPQRKPLKIGIHQDILAAAEGAIADHEVSLALRHYCNGSFYLHACVEGADRLDLDGNVAGTVTADEAAHAADKLAQYQARQPKPRSRTARQPRSGPITTVSTNTTVSTTTVSTTEITTKSSRLTFADLRAAAAARKAAAS